MTRPRFDASEMLHEATRHQLEHDTSLEDVPPGMVAYPVRRVAWAGYPGTMLRVPADMVIAMAGNVWDPNHMAGLVRLIRSNNGTLFEAPAARVYRVSATHVEESQEVAQEGGLEDSWGMTRPWEYEDVGRFYAQLLDGNHRAFAALAAGEPEIYVRVGEQYREDVRADLEGLHRRRG